MRPRDVQPKDQALTCSLLFENVIDAIIDTHDWDNVGVLRGHEIALPLLPDMLLHPVRSVWREAGKVATLLLGALQLASVCLLSVEECLALLNAPRRRRWTRSRCSACHGTFPAGLSLLLPNLACTRC